MLIVINNMGKDLKVTFYENHKDLEAGENGILLDYYQDEYQNIPFYPKANYFSGNLNQLLTLILELTAIAANSKTQSDDHWNIAYSLRCLWSIYYEFRDWVDINYVQIEYT